MKFALPVLLALALLAGCASTPPPATTFILVRHAEKVPDGSKDPELTPAGLARADALAVRLADVPLDAVYSTDFRRTRQTAAPTARGHGLQVISYDAKEPAADFSSRLKREHSGQTVLVVGHSNTVPGIAAALCSCTVAEMSEAEYDRLTTVRVGADGKATLEEGRQ
ncbi:histidine phosphatase family protein [Lysobacter sp. S4-A87]|uniref:histidine phosphatase family protein n=1 Tax=Lysobacter sp. S4-A87 TaxID=2925843 RepID=UPI001F53573D|nr:phosphoglycerate mutase family protein [Lysobacter sp. S4-A87]UNK50467.1 histidine phosphatase family protein [Lysobacter sp. S4-A87]